MLGAYLAAEGIEVEVVDPRTIVPLDFAAILASVEKTGRVVVVDECRQSCSAAAELLARIAESGFDKLKAPPARVTTFDVPVPFSAPLAQAIGPSEARIATALRATLRCASQDLTATRRFHEFGCGDARCIE
jgi:pyruvate dehydrogenase E1 component beta subunit